MKYLGLHLPGGLPFSKVAKHAQELGLDAFQFCMHSPNQAFFPKTSTIRQADCEEFSELMYDTVVINHSSYMLNLASQDNRKWGMAKGSLKYDLKVGKSLGVGYNVIHGGSYGKESTLEEGMQRIVEGIKAVLADPALRSAAPKVLIENTAGYGTAVNGDIDNLIRILEMCNEEIGPNVVGFCLDTTHAYARGYNVFNDAERADFIQKYGQWIDVIHFNSPDDDCDLGSGRDRHGKPFENSAVSWAGINSAYHDFKDLKVPMIIERALDEGVLTDFNSLVS